MSLNCLSFSFYLSVPLSLSVFLSFPLSVSVFFCISIRQSVAVQCAYISIFLSSSLSLVIPILFLLFLYFSLSHTLSLFLSISHKQSVTVRRLWVCARKSSSSGRPRCSSSPASSQSSTRSSGITRQISKSSNVSYLNYSIRTQLQLFKIQSYILYKYVFIILKCSRKAYMTIQKVNVWNSHFYIRYGSKP